MPSFQLCGSTVKLKTSKLIPFDSLHFRDNWGWPGTAVCMWLICSNRKFYHKKDIFATVTMHNNLFCHRLSDHLHCTNRPFTYVLRKYMSTLFRRLKCAPFRKNVLNVMTRKSNLNTTTWLTFCDGSFTIIIAMNSSVT